jgi:hypothetical protein
MQEAVGLVAWEVISTLLRVHSDGLLIDAFSRRDMPPH